MKRPVGVASAPVGVDIELEKIVVGVSVVSTFVLLSTVVRSSCVVAELMTVEVAAAPPAVPESVSTEVTTTSELLVKIEVARRIEVSVADTVTGTGTGTVTGSDTVTDSGAGTTEDAVASVGHTPAFTIPKGSHCDCMNFCPFAASAASQVLEIQQFVPVWTFWSLHMHFVSLISQTPPILFGVWNF
jgi:hypothetical protein